MNEILKEVLRDASISADFDSASHYLVLLMCEGGINMHRGVFLPIFGPFYVLRMEETIIVPMVLHGSKGCLS